MNDLRDIVGKPVPFHQIKGWSAIASEESELRNDAMLGFNESICGLKVKPLNFRHVLWLDIYDSPFPFGLKPEWLLGMKPDGKPNCPDIHLHIARFMWVLSPSWKPFSKVQRWLYFRKYKKLSRKVKINEIVTSICKFMDDSTFDLRVDGSGAPKSYYSNAASVVHRLSSIYNLNPFPNAENAAIDLPLKIAGQLLRAKIKDENPKATFGNRTDPLERGWLEELNRQLFKNQ